MLKNLFEWKIMLRYFSQFITITRNTFKGIHWILSLSQLWEDVWLYPFYRRVNWGPEMLNDLSSMELAISKELHQGFWFQNNFSSTRQALGGLLQRALIRCHLPPWGSYPNNRPSTISGVMALNTHKDLKFNSTQTLRLHICSLSPLYVCCSQ